MKIIRPLEIHWWGDEYDIIRVTFVRFSTSFIRKLLDFDIMSLEEYKKKRDFSKTKEPPGEVKKGNGKIYVIQKHYASHLHWDLRLEKEGVLKSWAVPKEPPTKKGVRRLIISTEDHPIDYADFEGEIAEGMYGAGKVEIWDRGTYDEEKWGENDIILQLKGKLLNGRYCLIRFKKVENGWLFFRCDKNGG